MTLSESAGETVFVGLDEYPKEITLRDGGSVTLRPMDPEDRELLVRFASTLPEFERIFLRDDIINPDVLDAAHQGPVREDVLALVATDGDRIAGFATVQRYPHPWNRHMGNIRVTVSPDYRRKGLARTLLGEVFCRSLPTGIEKVIAEVVRGQDDALKALARLGFVEEAVLRDHHLDQTGMKHDVVVMASDLSHLWEKWLQYCETMSGTWDMED